MKSNILFVQYVEFGNTNGILPKFVKIFDKPDAQSTYSTLEPGIRTGQPFVRGKSVLIWMIQISVLWRTCLRISCNSPREGHECIEESRVISWLENPCRTSFTFPRAVIALSLVPAFVRQRRRRPRSLQPRTRTTGRKRGGTDVDRNAVGIPPPPPPSISVASREASR